MFISEVKIFSFEIYLSYKNKSNVKIINAMMPDKPGRPFSKSLFETTIIVAKPASALKVPWKTAAAMLDLALIRM